MVLTRADDYPIHQTPEPIAYAGTDRNFYDRYFFNGYASTPRSTTMFAVALGVYPHLNIIDASLVVVKDGVQTALHASRWLRMERMDLTVGPFALEVVEPLRALRVKVDAPKDGVSADILFQGRAAPIEEPRFVRRQGPRTFMDYTRLTQNGRYAGTIVLDGAAIALTDYVGTRDRSWGVRPVGARDPQGLAPPEAPQFFWLWSPVNFDDGSFFFHVNDDAAGRPWNTRAVFVPDEADADAHETFADPRARVAWRSQTRWASSASIALDARDPEAGEVRFEPVGALLMNGLGYGHPTWGHGFDQGALRVEREDVRVRDQAPALPHNLHIQALSEVRYQDRSGRVRLGRGVLEQLAIGPHAPSGFKDILDLAP